MVIRHDKDKMKPGGQAVAPSRSSSLRRKIGIASLIALACAALYILWGLAFSRPALLSYMLSRRVPKLLVIAIVAYAIGSASVIFQTIIRNNIVTPCLLGMDQLYTLIHTAVYFFLGTASVLVQNQGLSFLTDLVLMGLASALVYGLLFRMTGSNVLYILLIGTVLTSLFGSLQSTLTRVMDPNEYETLLATLIPSFDSINTGAILLTVIVLGASALAVRRDLAVLDVLSLGKSGAISLGVDYDRCVRHLLIAVTFYIACATALVGPLAYLGLIIANLSRQFLKTYRHAYLIAGSVLFGAIVLYAGQAVSERLMHYNVPVSVFISVGGGLYFLYLLLRGRKAVG